MSRSAMLRLGVSVLVLVLVAMCGPVGPAGAEPITAESSQAMRLTLAERQKLHDRVVRVTGVLRDFEATGDRELERCRRELAEARGKLAAVRQFEIQLLLSRSVDQGQRIADLQRILDTALLTLDTRKRQLRSRMDQLLKARDPRLSENEVIGWAEGEVIAANILAEVPREMLTALFARTDGGELRTAQRLAQLAQEIAAIDPANPAHDPDIPKLVRTKAAAALSELAVSEYRRVAWTGLVIDPSTNQPIGSTARRQLVADLFVNLAELLRVRSRRLPHQDLFYWDDDRAKLAAALEQEVRQSLDYQIAAYLDAGIDPEPRLYYAAVARALRAEQEQVNTWFSEEYLGTGVWKTGLGQLLRANDASGTGDAGVTRVRQRLVYLQRDLDQIVEAFNAAVQEPDPDKLSPKHHRILSSFGYIDHDDDNVGRYVIPRHDDALDAHVDARRNRADLPAASVLDVVTPKNVAIAVASVVVPELMSARVAAVAEGLLVGERGIAVLTFVTETAVGTLVDAAVEKLETGKIDGDRLMLESVVLGGTLQTLGGFQNKVAQDIFARLEATESATWLARKIRESPQTREMIATGVGDLLGIASESVVTATFNQITQNAPITMDSLLSTALQGAMSRAIAHRWSAATENAAARPTEVPPEWIADALPPGMKQMWGDENFRRFITDSVRKRLAQEDDLLRRFGALTNGGQNLKADHLFDLLLSGDLTWSELKTVYEYSPKAMHEAMTALKERRDAFFESMVTKAQDSARAAADAQYDSLRATIMRDVTDPAERQRLIQEANRDWLRIRRQIERGVEAPGSGDVTSDIDRSSFSHLLRRHLSALYRAGAYEIGAFGDLPTSARALDVNEYINVFPFIRENQQFVAMLRERSLEGRNHGETMSAMALAAAMQHMSGPQRQVLRDAMAADLTARVAQVAPSERRKYLADETDRLKRVLEQADEELALSREQLETMKQRVVRESGRSADDPDVLIIARERLYDQRMHQLDEQQFQLALLERPGRMGDLPVGPLRPEHQFSDAALQMRMRIEQNMSRAMRDGIETYSNPITLDLVINRVQAKFHTEPDGSPKMKDGKPVAYKIADRLADPNFTLKGELSVYSRRDMECVRFDQLNFLAEHINAYTTGHESAYLSARALGKYMQRLFLVEKIVGDFDPQRVEQMGQNVPRRRLFEFCQIVTSQRDPDTINGELIKLAGGEPRTPDNGMMEVLRLIEQVVPELRRAGATAGQRHEAGQLDDAMFHRMRNMVQRRLSSQIAALREAGDAALSSAWLNQTLLEMEQELASLEAMIEHFVELASRFDAANWALAVNLRKQLQGLEMILSHLPFRLAAESATTKRLQDRIKQIRDQLAQLERGDRRDLETVRRELLGSWDVFAVMVNRRDYLRVAVSEHRKLAQEELQRAARERELAKLNLSGEWIGGSLPRQPARIKIQHNGESMTMQFTWQDYRSPGPHVEIAANYRVGRIRGSWWQLRTGDSPDLLKPDEVIAGPFEARVEGERIVLSDRMSDIEAMAIPWAKMIWSRAESGVDAAQRAFTYVEYESLDQPDNPPTPATLNDNIDESKGRLWVWTPDAAGANQRNTLQIFKSGGPGANAALPAGQLVQTGESGRSIDLPPGEYKVMIPARQVTLDATVAAGRATVIRAPGLARIAFDLRFAGQALEVVGPRLLAGRKPMAVRFNRVDGKTQAEVLPGEYTLSFMLSGGRYTMPIVAKAGEMASVRANVCRVMGRTMDADGLPLQVMVEVYEKADRTQPLLVAQAGEALYLPPGDFVVCYRGLIGKLWYPLDKLEPGERQFNVQWGRLMIEAAAGITVAIRPTDVATHLGVDAGKPIDLPAGEYEVRWSVAGTPKTALIQLRPGETKRVKAGP